jgi:hypothetical protein
MLASLVRADGPGRRSSNQTSKQNQKRRVSRNDQGGGIASKVAKFFESVLVSVNKNHGLDLYPLNLKDTLSYMHEGKLILEESTTSKRTTVLAQSQLDLLGGAGRAHTSAVIGVMAKGNKAGKLSTKEVADITGKSESWIRTCRRTVVENGMGAFGSTSKSGHRKVQSLCPTRLIVELGECTDKDCRLLHDCQRCKDGSQCSASTCKKWDALKALRADKARVARASKLTRASFGEAEAVATQRWMARENPARSGDQKAICWMVKGRFDFYCENFRSLPHTHTPDTTLTCTHTRTLSHVHTHTHTHTLTH